MTLRLPAEQADELEAVARAEGISVSDAVREAITEHIARKRKDRVFRERLHAVMERDREILERLARWGLAEHLDLADYLLIAEVGVPAEQIVRWPGIGLGLRPPLDKPVELVLPTHGEPADRAALERALAWSMRDATSRFRSRPTGRAARLLDPPVQLWS
jgi:hypothetical protein